jgi:LysR family nitrogen assimilation transcriptional regulator
MDLKHIETFICVFEECNITRAAMKLNIVQPAVSTQIRQLEAELGVSLFDRSTRGLAPTPAGRALYRLFEPVVSAFRGARKQAMQLSGNVVEDIRIGLSPYVSGVVLSAALQEFRLRFPSVKVHIEEQYSPTLIERVSAGDLDLAVTSLLAMPPNVHSVQLFEEDLVLVEKGTPADARPSRVNFSELATRGLILPKPNLGYRQVLEDAAEKAGVKLAVKLEITASEPLLELVAQGELATVIPKITAIRAAKHLPLRIRQIVNPSLKRKLWYVHRKDRPLSAALEEFVRTARMVLNEAAGADSPPTSTS